MEQFPSCYQGWWVVVFFFQLQERAGGKKQQKTRQQISRFEVEEALGTVRTVSTRGASTHDATAISLISLVVETQLV